MSEPHQMAALSQVTVTGRHGENSGTAGLPPLLQTRTRSKMRDSRSVRASEQVTVLSQQEPLALQRDPADNPNREPDNLHLRSNPAPDCTAQRFLP